MSDIKRFGVSDLDRALIMDNIKEYIPLGDGEYVSHINEKIIVISVPYLSNRSISTVKTLRRIKLDLLGI